MMDLRNSQAQEGQAVKVDARVVYGARCSWWDSISQIGKRQVNGHSLPCCPKCGGVLFEIDSEVQWWANVDAHEAKGNPGYRKMMEWMRGKCMPSFEIARRIYESEVALAKVIPDEEKASHQREYNENLGLLSISGLIELIEDAREIVKEKQNDLRDQTGGCSCHISPPCSYCVEGGSLEVP
jgi:hypothetical protein